MLTYREFTESDRPQLEEFCRRCEIAGHRNNASFAALKLEELRPPFGQYWLVLDGGEVVGISGCHHFPQVGEHTYRILYRSCVLESHRIEGVTGLFRNITVNEPLFRDVVPLQIAWARQHGAREFVITTNAVHDEEWKGKMLQMNRVLALLEKQKTVSLLHAGMEVYHCRQNVWRLDEAKWLRDRALAGLSGAATGPAGEKNVGASVC